MQFRDFLPVSTNTSVKESCYGALGALIGLLGTALLCRWGLAGAANSSTAEAPMGAMSQCTSSPSPGPSLWATGCRP